MVAEQAPVQLTLEKVTDSLYVLLGSGGNAALLAANAEIILHKNARANMAAAGQPGIPHVTTPLRSATRRGIAA